MTPLIISTRRSDATLRAIRSVTMVGNVSTFLTYAIGDPTGTQPTVGLTPRTITDPASFMVAQAGLEPATSSTPSSTARSLGSLGVLASPVCPDFRRFCAPGWSGLTGPHGLNGSYAEWCPTSVPPWLGI